MSGKTDKRRQSAAEVLGGGEMVKPASMREIVAMESEMGLDRPAVTSLPTSSEEMAELMGRAPGTDKPNVTDAGTLSVDDSREVDPRNEPMKGLYDALRADGCSLPEYGDFRTWMGEDANRRKLYDALRADGCSLPDDYDEFAKAISYQPNMGAMRQAVARGEEALQDMAALGKHKIEQRVENPAGLSRGMGAGDGATGGIGGMAAPGYNAAPVSGGYGINPATGLPEPKYLTEAGAVYDKGEAALAAQSDWAAQERQAEQQSIYDEVDSVMVGWDLKNPKASKEERNAQMQQVYGRIVWQRRMDEIDREIAGAERQRNAIAAELKAVRREGAGAKYQEIFMREGREAADAYMQSVMDKGRDWVIADNDARVRRSGDLSQELNLANIRLRTLRDAKERYERGEEHRMSATPWGTPMRIWQDAKDYTMGFAHGVKNVVTNPMGMVGAFDALATANILDKLERREDLTESEEAMLDATVFRRSTDAYSASKGIAYQIGEFVPEVAEMAAEFGFSPLSGATRAVCAQGIKTLGKLGFKKLLRNPRFMAKVAGTATLEGASIAATTQAAKNYSEMVGRMVGDPVRDAEGKVRWISGGDSFAEAFAKTAVRAVGSNAMFVLPTNIGGNVLKALEGQGAAGKIIAKLARTTEYLPWHNPVDALVKMKSSELISVALGDESWGDYTDEEANAVLLGSVLAAEMTSNGPRAAKAAAKYASARFFERRMKGAYFRARNLFEQRGGEKAGEAWDRLADRLTTLDTEGGLKLATALKMMSEGKRAAKGEVDALMRGTTVTSDEAAAFFDFARAMVAFQSQYGRRRAGGYAWTFEDTTSYDTGGGDRGGVTDVREIATRSFDEGFDAAPSELDVTRRAAAEARQRIVDKYDEDYAAMIDADPIGFLDSQQDAVSLSAELEYINLKARQSGIEARISTTEAEAAEAANAQERRRTNRQSGMVMRVRIGFDEESARDAYVVSGNVALLADGLPDRSASDNMLVVMDAESGALEYCSPDKLMSVEEVRAPREVREAEEPEESELSELSEESDASVAVAPEQAAAPAFKGGDMANVGVMGSDELQSGMVVEVMPDGRVKVWTSQPVDESSVELEERDGMVGYVTEMESRQQGDVAEADNSIGRFGKIFKQFVGKAKEAYGYLSQIKSGQARGVFYRPEIGDIDLVWGDAPTNYSGKGLAHIERKHVNTLHDFNSMDEAMEIIEDVIHHGLIIENGETTKAIEKDGYRAVIVSDQDGNWLLTAFDYTRSKKEKKKGAAAIGTAGQPYEESRAVDSNLSVGKGTENAGDMQAGALTRVPLDKKGKPDYEAVDSDTAWDALVERSGGDEAIAGEIAAEEVAAARGRLAAAEDRLKKLREGADKTDKSNKANKANKAAGGKPMDIDARIAAKKAAKEAAEIEERNLQEAVESEKLHVAKWEEIADVKRAREIAARAEVEKAERAEAEARSLEAARRMAEEEARQQREREELEGVPDFSIDKPEDARRRGFVRVAGTKIERQQPFPADHSGYGMAVEPMFASGANPVRAKGRVLIAEVDDFQPSHVDGRINPAHMIPEGQPKARHKDGGVSLNTADQNAKNIDPKLVTRTEDPYTGAPVVNRHREGVQGNGRLQMLRLLYEKYPEKGAIYKQYLIDHAEEFGVDPEYIRSLERPAMAIEIEGDDARAIELGQMTSQDNESGGIERIKPKHTARKMGENMSRFAGLLMNDGGDGDASFSELVTQNGPQTLEWMNRNGYISDTQMSSALRADGRLTEDAVKDLKDILYQSVFDGAPTRMEEMFAALPAKAQKAILATAYRDHSSPEAERLVPEIQNAIVASYMLRSYGLFAEAKNPEACRRAIESWKAQSTIDDLGNVVFPAEIFSNFALELAARFKGDTQKQIQTMLGRILDAVQGRTEDLFAEGPAKPMTVAEAIREVTGIDYKPTKPNRYGKDVDDRDALLDRGDQNGEGGRPAGSGTLARGEHDQAGAEPTERGRGADGVRPESGVSESNRTDIPEPSEAQKEAGNYKKEHRRIDGYRISIENAKGSVRRGTDASGESWKVTMHNDYGYIRGTKGVDGDHIDVFLSDTPEQGDVFVVDQVKPDGSFDEHKVMYGFATEEEARQAYLSNYSPGWKGLGAITHVSKEEFKKWVESSKRKTKPFADYKNIRTESSEKSEQSEEAKAGGEMPATDVTDANQQVKSVPKLYDRSIPATREEQRNAITRIIDFAKKVKDRVERAVIGGITKRQKDDFAKFGIDIDDSWVHSFETSAVSHNQKHHGNSNIEAARGQIAITAEDYNRIPDILDHYDKVSKSPNKTKGTENDVIIYEKEFDDGYVFYLEEKRDNRKSLAFHTMYKKKKGTDSSDGFAVNSTAPITPKATPDNLDSISEGKGSGLFDDLQEDGEKRPADGDKGYDPIAKEADGVYEGGLQSRNSLYDKLGNPVDERGRLLVESVRSIADLTDKDFTEPKRNVELPTLPANLDNALGLRGRKAVIKKNIFEKNRDAHKELSPEDSRGIIKDALYNTTLVGVTQPIKRPDYRVAVRTGDKNSVVVLDIYAGKENVEIVGWRRINSEGLEKMKRQAEREGGQFLILSPVEGSAAALSALPSGVSSDGKGKDLSGLGKTVRPKDGSMANERRRRYHPTAVGRGLFDGLEEAAKSEPSEERSAAEQANHAIDSYAAGYNEYLKRTQELEKRIGELGSEDSREELQEQIEQEEALLLDHRAHLEDELREFYLRNNTPEDAAEIARSMVARTQAEVEVRRNGRQILKDIIWGSERSEPSERSEAEPTEVVGVEVKTAGGVIGYNAVGHLPDAAKGEFGLVERQMSLIGEFGFTGNSRVKDRGDVAYIFRAMEDYSIEHVFVAFQKGESLKVMHIGMGGPSQSYADMGAIRAGYDAFGADKIYLVHNHPTGNLLASVPDQRLMRTLEAAFPDIDTEGIIMDTTSGRYGTFHGTGATESHERPQAGGNSEVGVMRIDRAKRDKDRLPEMPVIRSSADVAAFVGGQRLGGGDKVSYLVLANNNRIVANFHTGYGSLKDPALAEELASTATKWGGTSVIVYGNVDVKGASALKSAVSTKSLGGVRLLDAMEITNGMKRSARDEGYLNEGMRPAYNSTSVSEPAMATGTADFEATRDRAIAQRGIVMPGLNKASVRVVEVPRHSFSGDRPIAQAKAWAKANIVGEHHLTDSNDRMVKYSISARAVDKYLSQSAIGNSENLGVHLSTLTVLPEVIGESIEAEIHPDYHKGEDGKRRPENGYGEDKLVHRFYGAVTIDGETYRVKTTIAETRENKFPLVPHSFEVTEIELLTDANSPKSLEPTVSPKESGAPHGTAKLLKGVEKSYDKGETKTELLSKDNSSKVEPTGSPKESGVSHGVAKLLKGVEKSYDKGVKLLEESRKEDVRAMIGEQGDPLKDRVMKAALHLAGKDGENMAARNAAMKAIGKRVGNIRKAMRVQKTYDAATVGEIRSVAGAMLESGLLDEMSGGEVKRLLGAMTASVAGNDKRVAADRLLDLVIDNQVRLSKDMLDKALRVKGSKTNAAGVRVGAKLDPMGQQMMKAAREGIEALTEDGVADRIQYLYNEIGEATKAKNDDLKAEYQAMLTGMEIARGYHADVRAKDRAISDLNLELTKLLRTWSDLETKEDRDCYRQEKRALEDAIRTLKSEKADGLREVAGAIMGGAGESMERMKAWREAEQARIDHIHHMANADMEGTPISAHERPKLKGMGRLIERTLNSSLGEFLLGPTATFEQMLRLLARHSFDGRGYVYERFIPGWIECNDRRWENQRAQEERLNAKAKEVAGVKRWSGLYDIGRQPAGTLRWRDGGEMKEFVITQDNLMYVYMANKMEDGIMKLRKMGISEEVMEEVVKRLDPRLKKLADWVQEEFLPSNKGRYNDVHKRMFNAPMAEVENYFPLKVLADARQQDMDIKEGATGSVTLPRTMTGAIVERKKNSLPLDILNSSAISIVLDNLREMEEWAAFAEYRRDVGTLLSYTRFRNQVKNTKSIYGSGDNLWNKMVKLALITCGAYERKQSDLDKAAVNLAKGVTGACIAFRLNTALKQFLSIPAFASEASVVRMGANALHPIKSWRWAMENLPNLQERWISRQAGNELLKVCKDDWSIYDNKWIKAIGRAGISPNAFVDALTVAIGSKSVYESKYNEYVKAGWSKEVSRQRAMLDAEIVFNLSQQSSLAPFMSIMQSDRTLGSTTFTIFRNSPMSYLRQQVQATREINNYIRDHGQMDYEVKKLQREGLPKEKAKAYANKKRKRVIAKNLFRLLNFGFILPGLWAMGGAMWYLMAGDDEEQKQEILEDAAIRGLYGTLDGVTLGGMIPDMMFNYFHQDEPSRLRDTSLLPFEQEASGAVDALTGNNPWKGVHKTINLLSQMLSGGNPQLVEDWVVAGMDFFGADEKNGEEWALLGMRILQVPQSQLDMIYLDRLGLSSEEARKEPPAKLARRFAHYKATRSNIPGALAMSAERWAEEEEPQRKRFNKMAKELLEKADKSGHREKFEAYADEYMRIDAQYKELTAQSKRGDVDYDDVLDKLLALKDSPEYQRYERYKKVKGMYEKSVDRWLNAETPEATIEALRDHETVKRLLVEIIERKNLDSVMEAAAELEDMRQGWQRRALGWEHNKR